MDKKPLIGVSICAVVLLVMGSLSNVVGYELNQDIKQSPLKDKINASMEKSRRAIVHQNVNADIGGYSKFSDSPFILYFNSDCDIKGSGNYLIIPFGPSFFQIFDYYKSKWYNNEITINCSDLHDTFFGYIDFLTIGGSYPKSVQISGFLKLVGFVGTLSLELVGPEPYPHIVMKFEGHAIYVRAFGYNRGYI